MFSGSENVQVTSVENPQMKIISFQNYKHILFILDQIKRLRVPLCIGMDNAIFAMSVISQLNFCMGTFTSIMHAALYKASSAN